LIIGLAFSGTKARGQPKEYFVGGWWEALAGDVLANAAPFVLFWTREFFERVAVAVEEMGWVLL
jgi:hypothetical protein